MINKLMLTPLEKRWILYDVGNSAFILLVSTILPIFSSHLAAQEGYTVNHATSWWGYIVSASTLLFVVCGPLFGTLADIKGQKKRFFAFFAFLGVGCCALLGFSPSWAVFLAVFFFAKVGYNGSLVFYDSMLTDITRNERMDSVSSAGYAFGYIGSCIPFVLGLVFVLLCRENMAVLPISLRTACIIALLITALWWLLLSLPLLKSYRQLYYVERPPRLFRYTFSHLAGTLKNISHHRSAFTFLIAFFFYIDGVYTIIEIATPYGQSMGIGTVHLLLALLLTQVVAFPCAIAFGRFSRRFKTRRLLLFCIAAYFFIALFAFFLRHNWQFWLLAVMVGMVQGGAQALSRSYFARLIPKEHSNEFFGFFDICGKGASVIGTFLMAFVLDTTGKPQLGVLPIMAMFAVGFFILLFMPENQADRA